MHSLVLNTFDAVVLAAAIYILHPSENREDLDDTLQHFDWAMERFQVISTRNIMAGGALNVLKAINVRLKKALAKPLPQPYSSHSSNASSIPSPALPTPDSSNFKQEYSSSSHPSISSTSTTSSTNHSNGTTNTQYTLPTISNLTEATPAPVALPPTSAWDSFSGAMPMAPNFDFSSMPPLQPMHDLLYNDLGTVDGSSAIDPNLPVSGALSSAWNTPTTNGSEQWQFEGDFGNDSFWGFMNTYVP